MSTDTRLRSDPSPLPLQPAILVLVHPRRRKAFVSFSTNARGRAAVLATAIRHRVPAADAAGNGSRKRGGKQTRNHLRDLPEGDIHDFQLMAVDIGLDKRKADARVEKVEKQFERKGFTIFGGARSAVPKVLLDGKRYTIVEAMELTKCKEAYQTVYRRIQRGWPVKEALGLVERG